MSEKEVIVKAATDIFLKLLESDKTRDFLGLAKRESDYFPSVGSAFTKVLLEISAAVKGLK